MRPLYAAKQAYRDQHTVFTNWDALLLDRAIKAKGPNSKDRLFKQAAEKLLQAQNLRPEKTYNLACLYALTGRRKKCRVALENAEAHGRFPGAAHLAGDEDFAAVRGKKWFKELLTRASASAAT